MKTLLLSVLLLSSSLACAQSVRQQELFRLDLDDGGPVGGIPEGWEHFSALKTSEIIRREADGRRCIRVSDDSETSAVGVRSPRIPLPDDAISCWVTCDYYAEEGNGLSIYIEFWRADGSRPKPHARSFSCQGAGKWQQAGGKTAIPPGAESVTVLPYSWSKNTGTGFYDSIVFGIEDNPLLKRGARPPVSVAHPCTLYKGGDVERAKGNVATHAWAQRMLSTFRRGSAFWMDLADDEIADWIPELTPFRVVDCPECGAGWRFAWDNVGYTSIRCKKCKFQWPDEKHPETETEEFPDPVGDVQKIPYYKGEPSTVYGSAKSPVYRLSGRIRYQRIARLSSLGALGKVYALTGEEPYAEKVRKVLLRLAQVYPHYLAHDWGRIFPHYFNLQSGKLSGWKLHDASAFIQLILAYDLTCDAPCYSDEDRSVIEEGCFREFARLMTATSPKGCCINDGPIAMGAGAMVGQLLGSHQVVAWAIEPPDGFLGFLDRYFLRDGHWYESSASYEGMAIGRLYVTPETLRGYSDLPTYEYPDRYDDLDLFRNPLLRKILAAASYNRMPDGCLPPTNDSTLGARYSGTRAEQQYYWYPTEENGSLMAWAYGGNVGAAGGEYALFRRDPELDLSQITPRNPSEVSLVRPGAGFAILRTGDCRDDAALLLDFGRHGSGHGHPDRMNILYYDFGRELVTDLGYLGAGHPNHPWIRSTAAHNVVIVDGKAQSRSGGELEAFSGEGPVKIVIASAPDAFKGITTVYRRYTVLCDRGPGNRYVADIFHIRGGSRHQFLFHGDGENIDVPDLSYESRPWSDLGDDEAGYKWLQDVRQADAAGTFTLEWYDTGAGDGARTRLISLQSEPVKLWLAKANGLRDRSTPFGSRDMHKAVIETTGPETWFVNIIEGVTGKAGVVSARRIRLGDEAGGVGLEIVGDGWRDIVVVPAPEAIGQDVSLVECPEFLLRGRIGVVRLAGDNVTDLCLLQGEMLRWKDTTLNAHAGVEGSVADTDQSAFKISADTLIPPPVRGGSRWLFLPDKVDGVYRVGTDSGSDSGRVLRLAGEPIMAIAPGDRFLVQGSARLQMLGTRAFRWSGTATTVRCPHPDGEGGVVWAKDGESWVKQDRLRRMDTSVGLDLLPISTNGAGQGFLGPDSPEERASGDTPDFNLAVDGEDVGGLVTDLGFRERLDQALFSVSGSKDVCPDVAVTLREETSGFVRVPELGARWRPVDARWVFEQRIPELIPGQYRMMVSVTDVLFREMVREVAFNTLGFVYDLQTAPIRSSNGSVCKDLGGDLGTRFYRAEKVGDYLELSFTVSEEGTYDVTLSFTRYPSYGRFRVRLDSAENGAEGDGYAEALEPGGGKASLGTVRLGAGEHSVRFEVIGRHPDAQGMFMGVCTLLLRPTHP